MGFGKRSLKSLCGLTSVARAHDPQLTVAVIRSQILKSAENGGERGFHRDKKVKAARATPSSIVDVMTAIKAKKRLGCHTAQGAGITSLEAML